MIADRNGFASGWRGVGFTFWNGKQGKKKKRNTIKIYSASLPIQSLLQTLVCPSCVNAYQSANQGQMFFIRIVYPPPLEKKILGR